MTSRQHLKRLAERVLRTTLGSPLRSAGRSLILAYHNVVPDRSAGQGDRSLHLPMSSFLSQLDVLEEHCRVLPLSEILADTSITDRLHIALTFDDAYRGAVELALPELARRRLPSTMFVAPGLLGQRSFWWDARADPAGGLSDRIRRHALQEQAGRQGTVLSAAPELGEDSSLPECFACASESQVRNLREVEGVTLGAHSWSHPNLTRIDPDSLSDELRRPLEWLRGIGPPMLPVLAYPYGLSSPSVEVAVANAGYSAALLVDGGWLTNPGRKWQVPRFNIPAGLSEDGFMLRLSGTLRLPSTLRDR